MFEEIFFDCEHDSLVVESHITLFRLIQSHTQFGSPSALPNEYPDTPRPLLLFEKVFERSSGFFRDCKHYALLAVHAEIEHPVLYTYMIIAGGSMSTKRPAPIAMDIE